MLPCKMLPCEMLPCKMLTCKMLLLEILPFKVLPFKVYVSKCYLMKCYLVKCYLAKCYLVKCYDRFWVNANDREARSVTKEQLSEETQEDRSNFFILCQKQSIHQHIKSIYKRISEKSDFEVDF